MIVSLNPNVPAGFVLSNLYIYAGETPIPPFDLGYCLANSDTLIKLSVFMFIRQK